MIASIIVGLASVPFTASTVLDDYNATIDNLGIDTDTSEVPQKFTRNMNSESFEQTVQTAYGKIYVDVEPGRIYEKLTRPDFSVIVEKKPEYTTWKLKSQDYELLIKKTGVKTVQEFSSPSGYLEKVEEMGNSTEKIDGDTEKVRTQYGEAKTKLQEAVDKMKEVKDSLPGQKTSSSGVVINEFISNPESGSELIELYNPSEDQIDLGDWTIEDNNANPVSINTQLNSGEYSLFNVSDHGFSLNNVDDIIILRNSEGQIVDEVTYGNYNDGNVDDNAKAPGKGKSVGRCPDASETWIVFNQTSIGESNC
ncbi:MAG: lamin tail domain-containing protein [Candidatus Aenigmatarchaeota archaeon]